MSRPADARALALQVLTKVERQDAYLNLALASVLDTAGAIDRRDAALTTELSYGVYRRLLALDAAIQAHCDRPLKKLEDVVLAALRLGAYQLLYLDRIPERAAVAETVNLVKSVGKARASGFTNAVLRAISRERTVPLPDAASDPIGHLSVRESHPRWLVERYVAQLGVEEAEALCAAQNRAPSVQVRVNSKKASREEVQRLFQAEGAAAEPTRYAPSGLTLADSGALERLTSYPRGLWQVQDEAAQCVGFLARPEGASQLLDACAAPGGKTCHLLERMDPGAHLLALDLHANKLDKIRNEVKRLGLGAALELRAADATQPLPEGARFERILVDAPCAGLGTLRRHPELRYRRQPADIPRLAELQAQILEQLSRHLVPGGLLVYAVCSTTPEEGQLQLDRFLAGHADFSIEGSGDLPPSMAPLLTAQGALATWPHRHEMDGFFAAALRKR